MCPQTFPDLAHKSCSVRAEGCFQGLLSGSQARGWSEGPQLGGSLREPALSWAFPHSQDTCPWLTAQADMGFDHLPQQRTFLSLIFKDCCHHTGECGLSPGVVKWRGTEMVGECGVGGGTHDSHIALVGFCFYLDFLHVSEQIEWWLISHVFVSFVTLSTFFFSFGRIELKNY